MTQTGTTVKQIGLREFQRSMYSHIKDLNDMPIILTKNAKPTFVVLDFNEFIRMRDNQKPALDDWNHGTPISVPKTSDLHPSWLDRIKAVLNKKLF